MEEINQNFANTSQYETNLTLANLANSTQTRTNLNQSLSVSQVKQYGAKPIAAELDLKICEAVDLRSHIETSPAVQRLAPSTHNASLAGVRLAAGGSGLDRDLDTIMRSALKSYINRKGNLNNHEPKVTIEEEEDMATEIDVEDMETETNEDNEVEVEKNEEIENREDNQLEEMRQEVVVEVEDVDNNDIDNADGLEVSGGGRTANSTADTITGGENKTPNETIKFVYDDGNDVGLETQDLITTLEGLHNEGDNGGGKSKFEGNSNNDGMIMGDT